MAENHFSNILVSHLASKINKIYPRFNHQLSFFKGNYVHNKTCLVSPCAETASPLYTYINFLHFRVHVPVLEFKTC